MKLLNPIDSKFNKMKKKQTKKRHSFNINKPLLNNERKIKFLITSLKKYNQKT